MKVVVDAANEGPRHSTAEPAPAKPLIEDLPLSMWESAEHRQPSPPPRARSRTPWSRRALPAVATLVLVAVLVVVVLAVRGDPGSHGDGSMAVAAGQPGSARAPGVVDVPLLDTGTRLPPVTCALPAFRRDTSGLRAFYRAQLGCLERAWTPVLERVHAPVSTVTLRLADDPETACGELPPADVATGLYCDVDETIYLPRTRTLRSLGDVPEAHLATLAHEYGHHVQKLSGILGQVNRTLAVYEPGSRVDRELTRRVELQANCFAGMFFASVSGPGSLGAELSGAAVADFRNWVDSETHGSSKTQLRWAETGFTGTTTACDTWSAPREDVD